MWGNDACAVVVNDEGQHAVWPAAAHVPDGWRSVGVQGSQDVCLDYIEVAWDDLRPRSLRSTLAATPGVPQSPIEATPPSLERDLVVGAALAEHQGTDLLSGLIYTDRTLDPQTLASAWRDVTQRHPMLRSRYLLRDDAAGGKPQVVATIEAEAPSPTWTTLAPEAVPESADAFMDRLRDAAGAAHRRPYTFGDQAGLIHAFDCGGAGSGVLVSHLHAVLDGRSLVIVIQDLLHAYDERERTGQAPRWAEPAADFRDFREYLARRQATTDRSYWRPHAVRDHDSPALTETGFQDLEQAVVYHHRLAEELDRDARAATAHAEVPMSTLVYVAWARMLARRSGSTSATFATALSQRFGSASRNPMVGNAVATIPLTVLLDAPIRDVLRETRSTMLGHRDHAWDSWSELLNSAGSPGAIVQSLVILDRASLQDRVRQASPQWPGVIVETLRQPAFGVVLHLYTEPGLSCQLTVDASISAEDARGLLTEFESDLADVVAQVRSEQQAQQDASERAVEPAAGQGEAYGLPYAPGWSLWPDAVLRSAGVEFAQLEPLGDPALASIADDVLAEQPNPAQRTAATNERFAAEFAEAGRRLNRALRGVARDPRITEALAWQNRSALSNGVGPLLRRDPETVRRNAQHRQHESMVASYAQRYAAKNDTIGFFGPVGWATIAPGSGITVRPGQWPVDRRSVHLEGWVVRAIAERYAAELRPWLVPRLAPHLRLVDGGAALRVPMADPIPLSPAQRAVFAAVDGLRSAAQITAVILARDPSLSETLVEQVLDEAVDARRLRWAFDLPHQDAQPLEALRRQLEEIRIPAQGARTFRARRARERALRDLDDLDRARRKLADAAGNADAVDEAMADLEALVALLTGGTASRRHGELYAGRTPAYEECRLGAETTIGLDELASVAEPMEVVLNASRWFAHVCSEAFRAVLTELHGRRSRELGTAWVPLSDLWMLAADALMDPDELLSGPLAELHDRWGRVLNLPEGWADSRDEVRLDASGAAQRSRTEFVVPQPTGSQARLAGVHSPDLMYVPGREQGGEPARWVLGEVHPAQNTIGYRTWVDLHDDPDELRTAAEASNGPGRVWLTAVDELDGRPTRLTYALAGSRDLWLAVSDSATGTPRARTIRGADAMVGPGRGGLRVRVSEPDGGTDGSIGGCSADHDLPMMEVFADVVSGSLIQHFDVIATRRGVTPRVSLGDLVLSRRTWKFGCADQVWATARSESERYLAVRCWAAEHGLPRHLFMRTTGEKKPVFLDLTSLVSIDLLARAVRRSAREAGEAATLTVGEMLPGPDDLWLVGPDGHGRTAELRIVAVDSSLPADSEGAS